MSKLGLSGINFCSSIKFWEVNFARVKFWQFLTKICVIFDKRVKILAVLSS